MFGLENKRGKGNGKFTFELEKEMKDPKKGKDLLLKIEKRIHHIKNLLRQGKDKEAFQLLGVLLYGYASLVKVTSRVQTER